MMHFLHVTDKWKEQGKRHPLMDIIAIAIIRVICGADDWATIKLYVLKTLGTEIVLC